MITRSYSAPIKKINYETFNVVSLQNKKNEEEITILPSEVIIEILSRLPLKSIIQLQLVCKEWHALIRGRYFVDKYSQCSAFVYHWHNVEKVRDPSDTIEGCMMICGCDGLLLMQSWSDNKYCLWNPAIHRVLELPDPHKKSYEFAFSYVPSTRNYRILSISRKSSGGDIYEVLTPDHSKAWRRLTFPNHNVLQVNKTKKHKVSVVSAGAVVHCIKPFKVGTESYEEIVSLDMGTECFSVTSLPKCKENSCALDWDGKLGLVTIVGGNLHLMLLEDYKKHRWGEEKIIRLPFMKKEDYGKGNLIPLFVKNGDLWFWLKNEKIFTYAIGTGGVTDIKTLEADDVPDNFFPYKASTVSFEGMVPDTKLHKYRPGCLL